MERTVDCSTGGEVYSLAHPFRFAELSLPFVGELYNGIAPKTFITIRGTVKRSQSQER